MTFKKRINPQVTKTQFSCIPELQRKILLLLFEELLEVEVDERNNFYRIFNFT